ncbi:hypothetical protein D1872_313500 [compost metagenome]
MLADKISGLMADIEIHTINAETFHLVVNGAGHDIARGKLATLVEVRHKPRAVRTLEIRAFTPQGFG